MPKNNTTRYRTYNGMINYDFFRKDKTGEIEHDLTKTQFKELVIAELSKEQSVDYFCLIAHNRDILDDESGTIKPYHVHFTVRYKNARTMNSVINSLEKVKLSSRNLTATQSVASSLLYLTHTTAQAIKEKKTRYEVSELSIFSENHFLDQSEKELWYRNKISGSVGQTSKKFDEQPLIIDVYREIQTGYVPTDKNLITLIKSYKELYTLSEDEILMFIRKHRKQFILDRQSYLDDYVRHKREQGKNHKLIYITGSGGIGKTLLAQNIAERITTRNYKNQDKQDVVFESSSSGKNADLLNQYENEPISIFDDLNVSSFDNVQHFLKLFEKNIVPLIQSRYNNKWFLSDYSLITKSESAESFINNVYQLNGNYSELNLRQQVLRRFSLIIEIEKDKFIIKRVCRDKESFEIKTCEIIEFDNLTYIEKFSNYDTHTVKYNVLNKRRETIIENIIKKYL